MEGLIAWVLLVIAFFSGEAQWYIASGVFAVAWNVCRIARKAEENKT